MMSRAALVWLNRALWTLPVAAVLALGLLVSLGRYYLPYVEANQRQLVELFNRRTGLRISLGHIEAEWQRLAPHFVIDDLRVYNPLKPDDVVVHVAHAELQLGVFRSIAGRTVAISRLRGRGVRVEFEETAPGRWRLPGFEPKGADAGALLDFLAAIYRANLDDTAVRLRFADGRSATVSGTSLALQRAGDFRRLQLQLQVGAGSAPFTLLAESSGDPRRHGELTVRGYAALVNADLTPLLPAARAFGVDLQHGRIDGAVWFTRQRDGSLEVSGRAALPQLDIAGFGDLELPPLTAIRTDFLLRAEGGRRQLWVPRFSATWSDVHLELRQLLFSNTAANPDIYALALPELQLAPLREALLGGTALAPHLREVIGELEPRGALRNLHLTLPTRAATRDRLRLRAGLDRIALRPWQGAPGVEGAGGYIDAGLHGGVLDLSSDDFAMEFPHVYREALHFDRVRGRIGWRVEGDTVLVNSGPIPVGSDAGSATAQFALELPIHAGGRPLMTLLVGLRDSAAQYRDRFIPYTLQPALLDWLGRSVRGGALPLGGFLYRGSLRAGESIERTVQLFLDVRDGELAYQPDWPPLHDLQAQVWVDDADALVLAPRARTLDRIALQDIRVELQHPPEGSWLSVRGKASGRDDDVLRLLRESPLQRQLGSALDAWRWRGAVTSTLDLGIPIGDDHGGERKQQLRIDSQLGPGTLTLGEQRIVVTDLRGPLNYSSAAGLQSPALSAKWYGKPVAVKVATDADRGIRVQADGRVAMQDLGVWLQQPLFRHADGDAPFSTTLRIAGDDSALRVQSDLRGAAIRLPPPYAKDAGTALPLDVQLGLGATRELLAELGDWADLRLRWGDDRKVDAAVLRLGKSGRAQFAADQLVVTGAVAAIDFDAWREIFEPDRAASDAAAVDDDALELSLRQIRIGELAVLGQTLTDLGVSGHRDERGWRLALNANQVAGTVQVPDDPQQPRQAQLNYLRLPAGADTAADGANGTDGTDERPSALARFDPARTIPLDLSIARLWLGAEEIGSLSLQVRPVEHGLHVGNISGQLRDVTLGEKTGAPASLTWTRRDGADRTEFAARLQVDDAAQALQRWRYEPVLTSKSGAIDVALRWAGAPDQFRFLRSSGNAHLRIDDGRFLKASSSASGALKVVGIFNFANFLKRLQLDFSDVFRDGVSFDEMNGGFALEEGVLTVNEPIEIKSPSSRFRLAGDIDFNTDRTDMELVATLPVASNLPWVAALAGGLPMAAGVYVASKIFENQVDRFASAAYDISGPWRDPQVKLRRVFDDKLQQRADDDKAGANTADKER